VVMEILSDSKGNIDIRWGDKRMGLKGELSSEGPTPLEMMLCALGACTLEASLAYCRSLEIEPAGLRLEQIIRFSGDGGRIDGLEQRLVLPPEFPAEAEHALLYLARRCPVKNLLESPPAIRLSLVCG
jgi:uncharacterized OsmC-like protein